MSILVVGLTGGIASGKSTVGKILARERDVVVVDADRIAWETYNPGTEVYNALVNHFGDAILNADETIDRKALGAIVFQDEEARQFLNGLVHPAVYVKLQKLLEKATAEGKRIFVVEAALLLEKNSQGARFFDKFIMVTVDHEEQIRRIIERDGIPRAEAERKIASQMPQEEKAKLADYIIQNSGDLSETEDSVMHLVDELRELPKYKDLSQE